MADHDTLDELTAEAAAKLLHVSVAHVNALADSGALSLVRRADDGGLRVSRAAVLRHKAAARERQLAGLDAMVEASRDAGLYDAELDGLPVGGRRSS